MEYVGKEARSSVARFIFFFSIFANLRISVREKSQIAFTKCRSSVKGIETLIVYRSIRPSSVQRKIMFLIEKMNL